MSKLLDVIVKAADEKKGMDIVVYEFSQLNPYIEYSVVVSTSNQRQLYALAQHIAECCKKEGFVLRGMEGNKESRWILIDAYDVVVHVFLEEERANYRLEQLYADLPKVRVKL